MRYLALLVAVAMAGGVVWHLDDLLGRTPLHGLAGLTVIAALLPVWTVFFARRWLRTVLIGCLVSATLALGWMGLGPAAPAVILVVVDCMRADLLRPETTPNLMRLVDEGWNFSQARSHSSWTRTAMPSLLSGRLPAEHKLYQTNPPDRIAKDVRLLAQYLDGPTALLGEQAQLSPGFGYSRGNDLHAFHLGKASNINRRALAWNSYLRTVPRYLHLHYLDIHGPYTPDRAYLPDRIPKSTVARTPSSKWRQQIRAIRDGERQLEPDDWAYLRIHYEAELRAWDAQFGTVLDTWQADGTLDSAYVVVTADHGEAFGEHGAIEHMRTPYDVLLRVPLVIRPPGGTAHRVIDTPVMHADVVPTVLRAMGKPVPDTLYGRDLAPLAAGGAIADLPLFAEERASGVQRMAVRWRDRKLIIEGVPEGVTPGQLRTARPVLGAPLLFDVRDEAEAHDLAGLEPESVLGLQGVLVAYLEAAAMGENIGAVDWEAAYRSGRVWLPTPIDSERAKASEGTMQALEALGYLE